VQVQSPTKGSAEASPAPDELPLEDPPEEEPPDDEPPEDEPPEDEPPSPPVPLLLLLLLEQWAPAPIAATMGRAEKRTLRERLEEGMV
jgi:hypothetical protein